MAIIRNPLFFSLSIVLGAVYVLYYLGLLRPALVVAQRTMDEVIVMAKTKLREVLIDDHGVTGRQLNKMAGSKENIELDDM